jgi:plasmid stabilization system protein ParE
LKYAILKGGVHRCFVRRFPYAVLFRIVSEDAIRVLVIRHHRRHPSFGLGRR